MHYERIYRLLVKKRRRQAPTGYAELHHIIPRSLGGTDDPRNLVFLTAREHFLAHYMLTRIYAEGTPEHSKMIRAFMAMRAASDGQDRYTNSLLYDAARHKAKVIYSAENRGIRNSQWGTMWITNGAQNMRIMASDQIPDGWRKGRIQFAVPRRLNQPVAKCSDCTRAERARLLFRQYQSAGVTSVRAFCRSRKIGMSYVSLTKLFREYIPELEIVPRRASLVRGVALVRQRAPAQSGKELEHS